MAKKNKKKSYPNTGYPDNFRVNPVPPRLPLDENRRLIKVYVEGYEDVAFWRGVFDDYESDKCTFEISVPLRDDLAKGKKIVMRMAEEADFNTTFFCVDSDFDYLFAEQTETAKAVNCTENIFHTYAYATENFLCYAPSLHNICVKATKNDTRIFDFEKFFAEYSSRIYPLFIWYAYSAQTASPNIFPLQEFKSSVKINYLDFDNNGVDTLAWLGKQVTRKVRTLEKHYPKVKEKLPDFRKLLYRRGVRKNNCYLFMHGHTLMDNVVMPVLSAVCSKLEYMSALRIDTSARRGISLTNEKSNYKNALQDVRNALLFNENYKECFLYKKVKKDIENYLAKLE